MMQKLLFLTYKRLLKLKNNLEFRNNFADILKLIDDTAPRIVIRRGCCKKISLNEKNHTEQWNKILEIIKNLSPERLKKLKILLRTDKICFSTSKNNKFEYHEF